MAFYLGILAVLAVAVPSALAGTCVECTAAYTLAYAASTASASRCTAAKNYAKCLIKASGSGCEATAFAALAVNIRNAISLLGSSCALTGTCSCQLNQMSAGITTTDMQCKAAADYVSCLYNLAATQESCDPTMMNNVYRWEARVLFSRTCVCSGHAIRFSLAMFLVVLAGMFFKD